MTQLETETCSRCGGSGKYSFCERYRDVCFKCAGQGKTLTKRGAAAAEYLKELRSVPAGEIKVGDYMRFEYFAGDSIKRFFAKVVEIKPAAYKVMNQTTGEFEAPAGVIEISGTYQMGFAEPEKIGANLHVTAKVRKGFSDAEKRKQFAAALAYQETLTKAGTVRKSTKKENA